MFIVEKIILVLFGCYACFVFMQNHRDGFLWIDDCLMDWTWWLRNDEDNLDFEAPIAGHHSIVSSADGPQYSYEDNATMGGGLHGKRSKIKHEAEASEYHGGNEDSVVVGSGHLSMLSPCCACSKLTIIFGCLIVILSMVIMLG
jgi:hypothetical protein